MLAFIGRIPATIRWLLLVVLVGVAAFIGGRYSHRPTTTTTTTQTTSTTTSNTVSSTTSNTTSNTASQQQAQAKVVYRNQATLKQDKDTDCTEKFDRETGKLVERHCVTKTSTTGTTSAGGGTTSSTTGSTTGSTTSSTTGTTTSNTTGTTTTNTATTTTTGGAAGKDYWDLHLGLSAKLGLLDGGKPALTHDFGVSLTKDLFGPLSLSVTAFTGGSAIATVNLGLGPDWGASGGVGARFDSLTKLYYGGSLDRRLFGPFWLGAWGYSDGTGGLSLSVQVP